MHLDEDQLQRLLDHELKPRQQRAVHAHLGECDDCRWRVEEATREAHEIAGLLQKIDHPVPLIRVDTVIAEAAVPPARWTRWAAGIMLAVGIAGAASAMPSSPVHGWIGSLLHWTQHVTAPIRPVQGAADRASTDRGTAGVAIAPGKRLIILFTNPERDGLAHVRLTERADVDVRAPAGSNSFTSELNRLVINNRGTADTFTIQMPRSAPKVEIQVNGTRIFLKHGSRITANRANRAADGTYILPLSQTRTSPAPQGR